jgi:hypothetical protein
MTHRLHGFTLALALPWLLICCSVVGSWLKGLCSMTQSRIFNLRIWQMPKSKNVAVIMSSG